MGPSFSHAMTSRLALLLRSALISPLTYRNGQAGRNEERDTDYPAGPVHASLKIKTYYMTSAVGLFHGVPWLGRYRAATFSISLAAADFSPLPSSTAWHSALRPFFFFFFFLARLV
ncbi:hypothetical protein F4819DRAFT_404704 [Hypoxylon fuscum]|nr:hypothetical protein F4819DRAFT_404704 [Hypoxylon fuscum]